MDRFVIRNREKIRGVAGVRDGSHHRVDRALRQAGRRAWEEEAGQTDLFGQRTASGTRLRPSLAWSLNPEFDRTAAADDYLFLHDPDRCCLSAVRVDSPMLCDQLVIWRAKL